MPIIRTLKDEDPYARISRSLLQDDSLSYEARGLAAYLLSKPENWEIEVSDLIKQSPDGRDKIYRVLKELERSGYLKRERERGKTGHLGKVCYVLFESKNLANLSTSGFATSGKTISGKTTSGKPAPYIERKEQTKELTNEREKYMSPDGDGAVCREVFSHWQAVMEHPGAKLTGDRRAKILARFREGYTVEQMRQSIDGCKLSPFHMGDNDRGRKFDALTLILRDGEHVERFISWAESPPNGKGYLHGRKSATDRNFENRLETERLLRLKPDGAG